MPWYVAFILVFVYTWFEDGIGPAIVIVITLFILGFVLAGSITGITKIIEYIKSKRNKEE